MAINNLYPTLSKMGDLIPIKAKENNLEELRGGLSSR